MPRVNLHLRDCRLDRDKSASQRARVRHRILGRSQFLLPACESPQLRLSPQRHRRIDYFCPLCDFSLSVEKANRNPSAPKSSTRLLRNEARILEDRTPNLFVLHYDLDTWAVRTVFLVPHFAFALSARRNAGKPLAPRLAAPAG